MRADATVNGVLAVRAIGEDELDWFVGLDPDAPGLRETISEAWADGSGRPEWTIVVERAGRPIGRVALVTEPLGCDLPIQEGRLAGLWLDRTAGDRRPAAIELCDAAARLARGLTPFIERRLNPEVHRDREDWRHLLEAAGFALFQEKEGFVWTDDGAVLPEPARLAFRSVATVGRDAYAAAMAATIGGTLDRNDRFYLEACGPAGWGRQMVEFLQPDDEPAWLLAYEPEGALAGYVAVGAFEGDLGTIAHIGVVPERRGRGYVDELLRAAAGAARARGYRRMLSDVDTLNAPMLAAMERNGHQRGVRPWHVWAYRRAIGGG
jgi:ribosomal protein S18 acetylase RimI-like enzyme